MDISAAKHTVTTALDRICAAGRAHGGLFPSMMDCDTATMLDTTPEPIPGQRYCDRAYFGSNLMHDEPTLMTLRAWSAFTDQPEYAAAAGLYLDRFASHCADTPTGLFPWGEHCYWHLLKDECGNSNEHVYELMHDHLRACPQWLWDELWARKPECVTRFAEGLDYHWKEPERLEYTRHAYIAERKYGGYECDHSLDFPRHSGFYLCDLAAAFMRTGRADFLEQIRRFAEYWWTKKDSRGLLLLESRSTPTNPQFHRKNAPAQTLSLAVSLLETAGLIAAREPALADELRRRAACYVDGFLAGPHDPGHHVYAILCDETDNALAQAMPIWGSVYGVWPASYAALAAVYGYRMCGDERLRRWAESVGRGYATQPFPDGVQAPAMDAGLGLGLLADLYDLTGEPSWLTAAQAVAERLMGIYCDRPLPRGAAGIGWYESQMGPGFLLHGLARTIMLTERGSACPLAADYTSR